jgi:hypothetical protein
MIKVSAEATHFWKCVDAERRSGLPHSANYFAMSTGFGRNAMIIYIIRNGASLGKPTNRCCHLAMAARAIDTLILTQGIGDIYRMYADAQRDGTDFNVASIPGDFTAPSNSAFDPVYMKKLYQKGYQMAQGGTEWQKVPPDFKK